MGDNALGLESVLGVRRDRDRDRAASDLLVTSLEREPWD
jgi:hypothetical protein